MYNIRDNTDKRTVPIPIVYILQTKPQRFYNNYRTTDWSAIGNASLVRRIGAMYILFDTTTYIINSYLLLMILTDIY